MAAADQQRLAASRNGNGRKPKTALSELGEKIFLDRYALKDMTKQSLAIGDTVIVCVNQKTRQREIGTVLEIIKDRVSIELRDGTLTEQGIEDVDKPLETAPQQMIERVARGIAAIETTPEKQQEWEAHFRWLLNDWKFVPGGRILTAAGTDQQLTFFNCMPPEQEILTATGYRPIGEVAVGDLVVTHRNRLRRVLHKFERETEELLYIVQTRKLGYDNLRVTGEHKVLAIRSEWVNKHKSRDGLKLQQEPQWVQAKDLRPGDFLAAAYNGEEASVAPIYVSEYLSGYETRDGTLYKPQQRSDYHGRLTAGGTHHDVKDRLVVDADLLYLFGRWLGDGNVNHRSQSDIPSGIKIVFALDEREEAEQIARIIEEKFGVETHLKLSSTERWLDLWANSMALGQFFKAFFGCYSYGKRIPPQLQQLPHDLTVALLKGLFTADGYISGNELGILLSNRVLATQVHQQLLRLGYLFSIKENTHRLARRPAYRIQASANECGPLFQDFFGVQAPAHDTDLRYYFEHNGLRWLRIADIAVEEYRGTVLDIEVEEDHSFVSAGVVVSNCYVVPSPKDSRRGIVDTLSQMMEIMSRGGGVGINLSSLRPQHAYVKGVNGRSSGSVSWGGLYSFVTGLIEQGGSRRGALMLILNVWHPDVLKFIESKREMGKITNANISVGLTDGFMEAVQADADWELIFPDSQYPGYTEEWDGDIDKWRAAGKPIHVHKTVKAREIWNAIIESAWASAEPGLWFIDRANKMSNSAYFSPLVCTNPCVTGDTPVATEHGYTRARDLKVGMQIRTPAGLKPIEKVYNNGVQRIYRIEFSDGGFLECTADHKLKVVREKKYEWVATNDLRQGDKVLVASNEAFGPRYTLPSQGMAYVQKRGLNVADYYDRQLGLVTGVVIGDGVLKKVPMRNSHSYQCRIAFGAHEEAWESYFVSLMEQMNIHTHRVLVEKEIDTGDGTVVVHQAVRRECYKLATLLAKIGVTTNVKGPHKTIPEPFMGMEKEFLAGLLDGLFSTDGSVLLKQDNPLLRFHTSSYALAQQVRLLLLQFGIHGRVYRSSRDEDLQYDGRSMYGTGEKYDVVVMNEGIARFYAEIGLSHPEKAARLKEIAENWHFIGGTWTASVVSIQDTEREEEVFDVYEPNTLTWITNGYVSFDCGEQPLPAWGICNLGAINLGQFVRNGQVQWDDLRQAVRYGVRFLDNVIDATPYFFEENQQQQQNERRVGLGIMGLADMLIRLGIRYGSEQCIGFLDQLGEVIATEAYFASADNAAEKGSFPMFDAEKLLQSGYMQAMPEPVREAVRSKGLRNVTLLTVAPTGTTGTMVAASTGIEPHFSWSYFRKSRLGVHEERVAIAQEWEQEHPGEPLPEYFVNAMQLTPIEHVRVQAAIQRWVDSAISKTCNVPSEYTIDQTRELYEEMYRLGCKGGTIYRDGSRDEQVLSLKKEEDKAKDNGAAAAKEPATESAKPSLAALWSQPKIRPRPRLARGVTIKQRSPLGQIYVTINNDDEGDPLEVFITGGKAGSDVTSMADGLGRLASLVLRVASPVTPRERLREIIDQLKGIGGARSMGFGKDRVRSLPDAVAQALEECYLASDGAAEAPVAEISQPAQLQLTIPSVRADLCPQCGEAAFVHEEGCHHCNACGYSEC